MYTILKKLSEALDLKNKDAYLKKMNEVSESLNLILRNNNVP